MGAQNANRRSTEKVGKSDAERKRAYRRESVMSHKPQRLVGATLVSRDEPAIEWREYDRIAPGTYSVYCGWAKHYPDRGYKALDLPSAL